MIFGLFGCPALGIAGAAYATIIGQIFGAVLGFVLMLTKNKDLTLRLKDMAPDWDKIKMILTISIPSILMSAVGSILTFILNIILITFSSTAVAVYGVYFKLQSFIFMPIFGMNNGTVPIIAYNYGARRADRMMKTIKIGIAAVVVIMLLGTALFQILPRELLMIFDASEELLRLGVPALRTISLHFPIAAICIGMGSVFQALGFSLYSMINSIVRQLVVLIPCAYVLGSVTGSVDAVWWSFIVAEVASLVLTVIFFTRIYKNVIKKL
jgi:Na+-driven multidrug efflux pump